METLIESDRHGLHIPTALLSAGGNQIPELLFAFQVRIQIMVLHSQKAEACFQLTPTTG